MKFTLFLMACVAVVVLSVTLPGQSRRLFWLSPLVFAAGLGLGWVIVGQDLANFPAYLRGSFEIASGYTAGMAREGPAMQLGLAVTILALLLAAIATQWKAV